MVLRTLCQAIVTRQGTNIFTLLIIGEGIILNRKKK
jgi:hypothetical protein